MIMQYRHQFFQVFCMFPTVPFVLLLMLPILLNQDNKMNDRHLPVQFLNSNWHLNFVNLN
jgi:hypothetical protein